MLDLSPKLIPGAGLAGAAPKMGPLEKFRKQKPDNLDQAEWDKLLDELGQQYASGKGHGYWTDEGKQSNEMERWVLEDIIAAGQRSGTLTKDAGDTKRKGVVAGIVERARRANTDEEEELALKRETLRQAGIEDEEALAGLRGDREKASATYQGVIGDQRKDADTANENARGLLAGLGKDFFALNQQDQNALADYLKTTEPMMAEILARASDPADLQRQLDAYEEQKGAVDKYKELTDPAVTAKERYLSEVARREFEAADKSNRMAVSEQLANRGLRSGGQEIAMNQSSQQQLSQDRLLKELGIQAGAVDRSMTALEGYSTASNQLGLAAGAIRDANDSQRQFEDEFRAKEAKRRSDLAGARNTAVNTTTKQVGDRDEKYYTEGQKVESDIYGRESDVNELTWKAGEKDYQMGSDYFGARTGITGRKEARAGTNLADIVSLGDNALRRLYGSGAVEMDEMADAEERRLARDYGA